MKRKDIKTLLLYAVIIAVIAVILAPMFDGVGSTEVPQYDDVVKYFSDGEVTEFYISVDNVLTMKLLNGKEVVYQLASLELFHLLILSRCKQIFSTNCRLNIFHYT